MVMRIAVAAVFLGLLSWSAPAAAATTDCEPARCAVQAALDQSCPCAIATNHGRYVSCVARVIKQLARDGEIPKTCRGKIVRCAARSICGKPEFVTCHRPTGSCDLDTGTCLGDATVACSTDFDCGTRCSIKRSAEVCEARGGMVGSGGTCCADCTAP